MTKSGEARSGVDFSTWFDADEQQRGLDHQHHLQHIKSVPGGTPQEGCRDVVIRAPGTANLKV